MSHASLWAYVIQISMYSCLCILLCKGKALLEQTLKYLQPLTTNQL